MLKIQNVGSVANYAFWGKFHIFGKSAGVKDLTNIMSKKIPVWESDVLSKRPHLWLWGGSPWRHLMKGASLNIHIQVRKSFPPLTSGQVEMNQIVAWSHKKSCAFGFRDLPSLICIEVVAALTFGEAFSWLRSRRVVTLETSGENRNDCFWGFVPLFHHFHIATQQTSSKTWRMR